MTKSSESALISPLLVFLCCLKTFTTAILSALGSATQYLPRDGENGPDPRRILPVGLSVRMCVSLRWITRFDTAWSVEIRHHPVRASRLGCVL